MKRYTMSPVKFSVTDNMSKTEPICHNGIIAGWIDGNYYDLSDPKIREALMKKVPSTAEWIHITKSANHSLEQTPGKLCPE